MSMGLDRGEIAAMDQDAYRKLHRIHADDGGTYGRKAAMLGELSNSGYEVPDGLVFPASCFDSFLLRNHFPYHPSDDAAYSSEIRERLRSYTLGSLVEDSIGEGVEDLRTQFPQYRMIVRTSALCEDSRTSSMAGVFGSFPGPSSLDEVCAAVRGCYTALFSDDVLDRHASGLIADDELRAGVIIQRYVAGEVSGGS